MSAVCGVRHTEREPEVRLQFMQLAQALDGRAHPEC